MNIIIRKQKRPMENFAFLLFTFSLTSIIITSTALDTISATESISDGQTIVSAGGFFELGFFSTGNFSNRYLGIWYKRISNGTVAWVANRESPLTNSSGVLKFNDRGILVLYNQDNFTIWSTNISAVAHQDPVLQLLDSGNLVIRDENDLNPENFLWQSFDYPDQTFLPGMKIGRFNPGLDIRLSSWNNTDDPSKGEFSYQVDSSGLQMIITRNSVVVARSGPWNGISFSGMPYLKPNPVFNYSFVSNQEENYYSFDLINKSVYTKDALNQNGAIDRYAWISQNKDWTLYSSFPSDNCDTYALCGAYGSCDISNSPVCSCLNKFVPKFRSNWEDDDWSGGCVRRISLDCVKGDGFLRYSNVKLPDLLKFSMNASLSLEECENMCLKNCSCMAYADSDITASGSGCYLWFGDLIDIKQFDLDGGQDLYIRLASSELATENPVTSNGTKLVVIVSSTIALTGILLIFLGLCLFIRKKKREKKQKAQGYRENNSENYPMDNHEEDVGLPHFDFRVIASATNNFSLNNMLGKGGFGPVYKGMLQNGQEVAIKRLSKESRQGIDEFKNEVKCIAKLHHRNLVKLVGYCIQLKEKMLMYEYMPNKSLDFYIFDQTRSKLLNWDMRFCIINGISRGLLYLHQDSRLRIIHRDLKLSNILLDKEMNPKISDFGVARSFWGNETEANTKRVVGTYGYMSPEYAIDGLFSVKSDVFSFGVLVLEIISGKKNRGFIHPDHQLNLLGHAWKLFKEGRYSELIDATLMDSCNLCQVLRSIHVGLLCVQHSPNDRPNMSSVVLMLIGEGAMPEPKEPGFFADRRLIETDIPSYSCSVNEITITMIDVR